MHEDGVDVQCGLLVCVCVAPYWLLTGFKSGVQINVSLSLDLIDLYLDVSYILRIFNKRYESIKSKLS